MCCTELWGPKRIWLGKLQILRSSYTPAPRRVSVRTLFPSFTAPNASFPQTTPTFKSNLPTPQKNLSSHTPINSSSTSSKLSASTSKSKPIPISRGLLKNLPSTSNKWSYLSKTPSTKDSLTPLRLWLMQLLYLMSHLSMIEIWEWPWCCHRMVPKSLWKVPTRIDFCWVIGFYHQLI